MSDYTPPLRDLRFLLDEIVDLETLSGLEGLETPTPDLVDAILEEAGKLASEVFAPLNQTGDQQGSRLADGEVRTPDGFKEAYRQFVDGGWNGVPFETEFGGQGMPRVIALAVQEMWASANLSLSLCPMLTQGAIELIASHGAEREKQTFLHKMIAGEWTGTMNLTEPQAGSDVGALRTKAEPQADGTYRITGSKIFITWGEHDVAENIIHMVLARTPNAPPGTKGISCFIVPKFLVNDDGSLGARNDVRCVSLEHKLGIHASPTAVLSFGDEGGAVGYLVGEEHKGMRCMFTMMNNARLAVGQEGVAITERAYQQALAYARERRQGRAIGSTADEASLIIEHADVRRMLMTMKAYIEAMRALVFVNAEAIDLAQHHPDADVRHRKRGLVELLTPISKAWCTDLGVELASVGVQVHGGMGFVEETGAAQHLRDSRIAPIYEGTNGIQALDLVMRKLPLNGGEPVRELLGSMRALDNELAAAGDDLATLRDNLREGVEALGQATEWLTAQLAANANAAAAGAAPYLRMFGTVVGGHLLARSAIAARRRLENGGEDKAFLEAKIATARFYGEQVLPQAPGLLGPVTRGETLLYAIEPDLMSA
jgi:alkylation response protein AidB-like acyl-CoA dehydrogenase